MTGTIDRRIRRYFGRYWSPELDRYRVPLEHESFLALAGLDSSRWWSEGDHVVEIGPGAGRVARALGRRGVNVSVVDISDMGLKQVGRSPGVRRLRADGERLPFCEGSADVVLTQVAAIHMDLDALAQESARVLRPGGRLVMIEPRAHHPLVAVYRAFASPGRGSGARFLTGRDVDRVASRFRSAWVSHHGLLSPLAGSSAKMAKRFFEWDRWLLRRWPRLGDLAWFSLIVAER